jgi:hypothetical protein
LHHWPGRTTWSVDRISFDALYRASVGDDAVLFFAVASASLVEFASGVYAGTLANFFNKNHEIADWLVQCWKSEEFQHGRR